MGTDVTYLIESIAPPLESPSSLVAIIPVKPIFFLNSLAISTLPCPKREETTNRDSVGLISSLMFFNSFIISLSI